MEQLELITRMIRIPIVAIGGIDETNVQQVMAAGIAGISVVSAILAKKDPRRAAERLRELME